MTEYTGDVVVVGGGLAGVCAAIAAARMGNRVLLAGNRPVLGGNSSSEIRLWTRGATGAGSLFSEEMGILGELKLRNLMANPDGNVLFWDEVLFDAVCAESNITLLLNTVVQGVEMDGPRVRTLTGYQMGSERAVRLTGEMYVDCTGDGAVAAAAGVPFRQGQEARSEYGEAFAPGEANSDTMGSSILYYVKRLDHPVRFVAPRYAHGIEHIRSFVNRGSRFISEHQSGSDYWWFEYGGLLNTIDDAQAINLELKRLVMGVWNYIKNSGKFDADCLTLEWVGNIAGKRESRRMLADYMLTQNDIQACRDFPDNAFYGGWYLDFHPAAGVYSSEENCTQIPVRTYPIPLRTLCSQRCGNLLFAGRLIGATHAAFASTRIMNTCALSGQAAGTLAALCLRTGLTPSRQAAEQPGPVQQRLLMDDMLVLGASNLDGGDLARAARVTASSHLSQLDPRPKGRLPLASGAFVQLAVPAGVQSAGLYAEGPDSTDLAAELFTAPLPSRLSPGEPIGTLALRYEPGKPILMPLPPCEKNRFVTLILKPCPGVYLTAAARAPLGFLMGEQWSMAHQYPLVRMPLGDLYAAHQVLGGMNRAYGQPNLWISREEPTPWLQLDWPEAVTFSRVLLYLNPDLAQELPSSFTQRWNASHMLEKPKPGRPWQLAGEMRLWVLDGEIWRQIASVEDNWQRRVDIRLPRSATASALRVTFGGADANSESQQAQVFEIRVY